MCNLPQATTQNAKIKWSLTTIEPQGVSSRRSLDTSSILQRIYYMQFLSYVYV